VFDCLYLRGRDLREEPLVVRRQAVEAMLGGRQIMLLFAARRLPSDGIEAWADVERRGLEGLVAKHEASRYRGGSARACDGRSSGSRKGRSWSAA
jgi:bifunctional non-homologous end joining protein LigD